MPSYPSADPTGTIGRALFLKLDANQGGTILVVSDSTGDGAGEWPDLMSKYLASIYPNLRVEFVTWSDGGSAWPATTVVQAGSGSGGTLYVYNCSVGSKATHYFLAPNFDVMVAQVQPDLTLVSLGHNEGAATTAEPYWRDDLLALTESITAACPRTELALLTQNARSDAGATNQAARRYVTMQVAGMRGYGLIDTFRAFVNEAGNIQDANLLIADGIHPSDPAGNRALWQVVRGHLGYRPGMLAPAQQPSSFMAPVTNLLSNGDFASFASPPTLTGWTATQATLSKDSTNYEGPNGYSVRLVSASAATAYMEQSITTGAMRAIRGGWVVLAARMFIPTGQNANAGRIHLRTSGAATNPSQNSIALLQGLDGWKWVTTAIRVPADATTLFARIYAENGATGTGDVRCDRAILAKGILPRDCR